MLQIENLSVDFTSEGETTSAVKGVSLTVNSGEILALVGESGSGKSVTSLSILQLLPSPPAQYKGSITFNDNGAEYNLLQLSGNGLQSIRGNRIGMIFQEPMTSLNPVMSCGRQVAEALLKHKRISKGAAKQQTIEWFEKVKLPNPQELYNRYPHQLSGGQKQRVMIAMAMCCNPALLICDEPTTALDVTVQKKVLDLIKDLQQETGMGVIFITHDLGVVAQIADRVAIMYRGEIVEVGNREAIFSHPQHTYTKALIACRPTVHSKGSRLPTIGEFLEGKTQIISEPEKKVLSNEALVTAQTLIVTFPTAHNLFGKVSSSYTAVDGVSFEVYRGETLGLVGESGCGKTTLGRTLLKLIEPTSGTLKINGQDVTYWKSKDVKALRRNVQLVFQDPFSSLNPRLTIGAAIAEPLEVSGIEKNRKAQRQKVAELLDKVALPSSYVNRYPHQFSGGQRQRIVIARALALEPHLLVCDESVSALDVSVQAQVLNLLNDLRRDLGLTMLFISHDLSVVRYMSDRIMVMQRGKIVESGAAEQVYDHPQTEYTKTLLRAIPKL